MEDTTHYKIEPKDRQALLENMTIDNDENNDGVFVVDFGKVHALSIGIRASKKSDVKKGVQEWLDTLPEGFGRATFGEGLKPAPNTESSESTESDPVE